MMNIKFYLIFVLIFLSVIQITAQNVDDKNLYISIDAGLDKSVNPEIFAYKNATINYTFFVGYPKKARYRNPGVRLRGSVLYPISNTLLAGGQIGLTARYFEDNWGTEYTYVTIPIQARVMQKIVSKNGVQLFADAAWGLNFFHNNFYPFNYKSGPILSVGILTQIDKYMSIRFGYEHQTDNCSFQIEEDPFAGSIGLKAEKVTFKQYRELLYISVGLKL